MIKQVIDINGYWTLIVLYDVFLGEEDTGFTNTNFDKKLTIIAISLSSSKEQFFNTLVHEIKHVQSHICWYYNVKEDSEAAAYLTGFIAQKMYKVVKQYI